MMESECKQFWNITKVKNLEEFREIYSQYYIFKKIEKNFTCYCATGFKYGKCLHSEALRLFTKEVSNVGFLIKKRTFGKKRKALSALTREKQSKQKKTH
jgi:hypothetical protein